jgi:hypothetical protein
VSLQQGRKINAAKAAEKLRRRYLSIEITKEIKEKRKLKKELL